MLVDSLPVPRTELSRSVLMTLADRPQSMGEALVRLRSSHRHRRVTVGRFFWEVDRLTDAGYLVPATGSLTRPVSASAQARSRFFRAWVRSGRLNVIARTRAFHLHIDLSVSASDSLTGGDES